MVYLSLWTASKSLKFSHFHPDGAKQTSEMTVYTPHHFSRTSPSVKTHIYTMIAWLWRIYIRQQPSNAGEPSMWITLRSLAFGLIDGAVWKGKVVYLITRIESEDFWISIQISLS